jgi:hypothetical protein
MVRDLCVWVGAALLTPETAQRGPEPADPRPSSIHDNGRPFPTANDIRSGAAVCAYIGALVTKSFDVSVPKVWTYAGGGVNTITRWSASKDTEPSRVPQRSGDTRTRPRRGLTTTGPDRSGMGGC